MKRLLWIFLLFAIGLVAQTPDCVVGFTFNATGQRSSITTCGKNTQGVIEWRVVYTNTGFTGPLSLRLESSQDGITWVTFAGTLNDGINPNTSLTHASTDMNGFNPFVSVALNAAAGSGTVTGVLYGCREPGCANFPGGGGSAGTGAVISCPNVAPITVTAGTDQRIITGVASTNIKLCQLIFSQDVLANMTIRQGTGTNCGTNTLALTGPITNVQGVADDINANGGTIATNIAARDMCLHFSTAVTGGGYALYAQN